MNYKKQWEMYKILAKETPLIKVKNFIPGRKNEIISQSPFNSSKEELIKKIAEATDDILKEMLGNEDADIVEKADTELTKRFKQK